MNPQPICEEIYDSLHWSVKKLLRKATNKVSQLKKKLNEMTENKISYDLRIATLKVNNNVKAKAMEKFKEIKLSKDSSNVAKATKYLDGLLDIPFEIIKGNNYIIFI